MSFRTCRLKDRPPDEGGRFYYTMENSGLLHTTEAGGSLRNIIMGRRRVRNRAGAIEKRRNNWPSGVFSENQTGLGHVPYCPQQQSALPAQRREDTTMTRRTRFFVTHTLAFLMAVLILLTYTHPVWALSNRDLKRRYRVTSNWNYNTTQNSLRSCDTIREAVRLINRQKASVRGQYFVYDAWQRKVVWPTLTSPRQRVDKSVAWLKAIANDNRHRYSMHGESWTNNTDLYQRRDGRYMQRWGIFGNYSCSTLAAMAFELTGFENIRTLCARGGYRMWDHGNRRGYNSTALAATLRRSTRFTEVTRTYRRRGRRALTSGALLLTRGMGHVGVYVGGGWTAEACGSGIVLTRFRQSRWAYAYNPVC